MSKLEEIRDAIRSASNIVQAPIGEFVFKPIVKEGYIIRHVCESKIIQKRYFEYLKKIGAKNFDFYKRLKTKTGSKVRSKAELIIANTLTDLKIKYYYEPLLDFGIFFRRPDFYLPNFDIIYEHFGKDDNPNYIAMMRKKREIISKV